MAHVFSLNPRSLNSPEQQSRMDFVQYTRKTIYCVTNMAFPPARMLIQESHFPQFSRKSLSPLTLSKTRSTTFILVCRPAYPMLAIAKCPRGRRPRVRRCFASRNPTPSPQSPANPRCPPWPLWLHHKTVEVSAQGCSLPRETIPHHLLGPSFGRNYPLFGLPVNKNPGFVVSPKPQNPS
jgi:hypothetical protein